MAEVLLEPAILFEILLLLPQVDLLHLQRVCRTWHKTITSSKVLQAALFLRPDVSKTRRRLCDYLNNPLLIEHFPNFFHDDPQHDFITPGTDTLGPWIDTRFTESIRPWPKYERPGNKRLRNPTTTSWLVSPEAFMKSPPIDRKHVELYTRPEASWKRMLPCQPAPTELQIVYERIPPGGRGDEGVLKCLDFANEDDPKTTCSTQPWLTFGLIYSIIEAAWFHNLPIPVNTLICHNLNDGSSMDPARMMVGEADFNLETLRYDTSDVTDRQIGGSGRWLLYMQGHEERTTQQRRYRGKFAIEGNPKRFLASLPWDSVFEY